MCVRACVPHAPLEELRGRRLGGSDFPWQLTFFPVLLWFGAGFQPAPDPAGSKGAESSAVELHGPSSGSSTPATSLQWRGSLWLCEPGAVQASGS